jgi:hypothetical protein
VVFVRLKEHPCLSSEGVQVGADRDTRNRDLSCGALAILWQFRVHPRGSMGKVREPQIILKTDQRNVILELGRG